MLRGGFPAAAVVLMLLGWGAGSASGLAPVDQARPEREPLAQAQLEQAPPERVQLRQALPGQARPQQAPLEQTPLDTQHLALLPHLSNSAAASGPMPQYRWAESNEGLASWSIVGVAVDHADPSTVYALTRSHGLHKSVDGGDSWVARNDGLPETHIVSMGHAHGNLLTMDPGDPRTLYANFNGQVHRYRDPEGWTNINAGIEVCNSSGVVGIVVDPRDSNHIFAAHIVSGCSGGIYESRDAHAKDGPTWTHIASWSGSGEIENDAWTLAIDPSNPELIYIGTGNGLKRSADGGASLVDVTNGISPELEVQATGIAPSNADIYYCNLYGVAFCRSDDRGRTWRCTTADPGVTRTITILVDEDDPDVVYAGLERLYKSVDGGSTWALSLDPGRHEQFFDLEMDSRGRLYAASIHTVSADERYAELYQSDDAGRTWHGPNESFHHRSVWVGAIVVDPSDAVYVATYDFLRKSTDAGRTWTRITNGLTGDRYDRWIDGLEIDPVQPSRLYLATRSHRVFASTDHGETWGLLQAEAPAYPGRIIVDHQDHSMFYVFGLNGWRRYVGFGAESAQMPTDGIDAPHMNFRRSALQDPEDARRFVTGDLFQGFLIFEATVRGGASNAQRLRLP